MFIFLQGFMFIFLYKLNILDYIPLNDFEQEHSFQNQ